MQWTSASIHSSNTITQTISLLAVEPLPTLEACLEHHQHLLINSSIPKGWDLVLVKRLLVNRIISTSNRVLSARRDLSFRRQCKDYQQSTGTTHFANKNYVFRDRGDWIAC
jgi:hypothetical protein